MSPDHHEARPGVNIRSDLHGVRRTVDAPVRRSVAALLLLAATTAVAADLDAGVEAYFRGDYAAALREFRPLAEQGDAGAQFGLGVMYAGGEGVAEDDRQAVFWYHQAAEQGHAAARYSLGLMYYNGEGVPEDHRQAVLWFRQAAEQGYAAAQHGLGLMYYNGEGVSEDHRQAVFWYQQAAEQGHDGAQLNLGYMYAKAEGVPEDDRQAVFWYRQAAEQGHAVAQYNLGVKYTHGEGVSEDDIRAYAWLNLAAARGHNGAKQDLSLVRQDMAPAQIAEAQKLSRELVARIEDGYDGSLPSPVPTDPALPFGPSRETVLRVQTYLAVLGYDPGPLDGQPGERTRAAIRRFQRDLELTPNGRISDELLALLLLAAAARQEEPAEARE